MKTRPGVEALLLAHVLHLALRSRGKPGHETPSPPQSVRDAARLCRMPAGRSARRPGCGKRLEPDCEERREPPGGRALLRVVPGELRGWELSPREAQPRSKAAAGRVLLLVYRRRRAAHRLGL